MLCLLLARPLLDVAYFPMQMQVIDKVAMIEHRNKFAYIFNHEFGLYLGRFAGCGLFIVLAYKVSDVFALRYALLFIGVAQLLSIWVAKTIVSGCAKIQPEALANEAAATVSVTASLSSRPE